MYKYILILISILIPVVTEAQCAMCKANAEAAQDVDAAGINSGIFIMLFAPYIMFIIIAIAWYRAKKKKQALA